MTPRHFAGALVASDKVVTKRALLAGLQTPGNEGGAVLDVPGVRGHAIQSLIGASDAVGSLILPGMGGSFWAWGRKPALSLPKGPALSLPKGRAARRKH